MARALGNYYAVLRRELSTFRGHEVNTAGDGLLATFDGPARAIRCAQSVREKVVRWACRFARDFIPASVS